MKIITLFLLALSLSAMAAMPDTDTGESPLGPKTMGQATYPNSGLSEASSANVTSENTQANLGNEPANGSSSTQTVQRQEENKPFQTGPYDKDGKYQVDIKEK